MIKLRLTYSGMQSASFSSFEATDSTLLCRLSFDLVFNVLSSEEGLRESSVIESVLTHTYSRL